MKSAHWLLKTEPETYSFDQLVKDRGTHWDGVRNYQARNNLKKMVKGDLALIYHSGSDKAVIGVAKVVRPAYPDGDWVQVDLEPVEKLKKPVTLAEIKASSALSEIPLIKQSRLSVMPVSASQFEAIKKMGHTVP